MEEVNMEAHEVSLLKKRVIHFSVPTCTTQVCKHWKQFLFLNSSFTERPNRGENLSCSSLSSVLYQLSSTTPTRAVL